MPGGTQAQYNEKTPALSFKTDWSNEKERGIGEKKAEAIVSPRRTHKSLFKMKIF